MTCDADGFTAIWQWADDAPAGVLARLHVRCDPLTGAPRPPSERTIRRTLALLDPDSLQAAAGRFTDTTRKTTPPTHPPVREREQRRAWTAPDGGPGRVAARLGWPFTDRAPDPNGDDQAW